MMDEFHLLFSWWDCIQHIFRGKKITITMGEGGVREREKYIDEGF